MTAVIVNPESKRRRSMFIPTKRSFVVCSSVVLCLIWPVVAAQAQQRAEREPRSVSSAGLLKHPDEVDRVVLDAPNVASLRADDTDRERELPLRLAHAIEASITP